MNELYDDSADLGFLLFIAVENNCPKSAAWLVGKGADVRENDSYVVTLAQTSTVLKCLLQAGANAQTGGNIAMLRAALRDDADSVELLIRYDATVTSDAWDVAVINGHVECVRAMLASHSRVDRDWAREYCWQNEVWDVYDLLE